MRTNVKMMNDHVKKIISTLVVLVVLLLSSASAADGFSPRRRGIFQRPQLINHREIATVTDTDKTRSSISSTRLVQESSSQSHLVNGGSQSRPPKFLYKLNASTKWLVTIANTLGIWMRFPHYEGPFVVIGAIAATYLTQVLKRWINHDRPAGAPFTDPGMPSSHSLVSFFLAAAWGSMVCERSTVALALIWAGASIVALLRVVCVYHSWDQIIVGAALGSSMGYGWSRLGKALYPVHPQIMLRLFWGLYVSGSVLFILTEMKDWLHKDKHL
jgi:hypothetical protein